jgi:hypothetical protein
MKVFNLACLLLLSSFCHAQKGNSKFHCIPCSYRNTDVLDKPDHVIPEKNLYCFIRNFSLDQCEENVEYSEYANELLFQLLFRDPAALIHLLERHPELNCAHLYVEIQNPLTDAIDVAAVIEKVKNIKSESAPKLKILLALRIAIGKNN